MSKNIVISIDGTPTTLSSVSKIETSLSGGGTCEWVPSDEIITIDVQALTVTANSVYSAPSGVAYSPVTVSVSGGGDDTAYIERTINYINNSTASYVASYAFASADNIYGVSLPACTTIYELAFKECHTLGDHYFPEVLHISDHAFDECYGMAELSFPKCLDVGSGAFYNCWSLVSADFPMCSTFGEWAFYGCGFASISMPACTDIGSNCLNTCNELLEVYAPQCTHVNAGAFKECHDMSIASFPVCSEFGSYAFQSCYNLLSLYLGASSVCKIYSDTFKSTPIAGYTTSTSGAYGSVYVPESLVSAYKAASIWSTYSNRITAMT